ncbi:hypothetical protein CRG98_012089 [Punica granatum]|uniref:Uncharacterized protein n=1 Tax=Punica granatum TaxID=22663 RepID=A0A2I0KG78_PUNGR|nr:hypothetical protein CRG98_012089 [Punica granatum]
MCTQVLQSLVPDAQTRTRQGSRCTHACAPARSKRSNARTPALQMPQVRTPYTRVHASAPTCTLARSPARTNVHVCLPAACSSALLHTPTSRTLTPDHPSTHPRAQPSHLTLQPSSTPSLYPEARYKVPDLEELGLRLRMGLYPVRPFGTLFVYGLPFLFIYRVS